MDLSPQEVTADVVRPLRHEVLRAGQPYETTSFPGDDHPLASHRAVLVYAPHVCATRVSGSSADAPPTPDSDEREVVSVGTVYPDPPPWEPENGRAWRIRGMATKETRRGQGLGRQVLDALVAHAHAHGGNLVWCHARIGAVDFYTRAGFVTKGGVFDDGVALHQSMWRALER